jgi:hypothetical protein
VTTIRNLNAADGTDLAMRDLINMGKMIGPRMFVSGPRTQALGSGNPPDRPRGRARSSPNGGN